jgi:hypothetical protein
MSPSGRYILMVASFKFYQSRGLLFDQRSERARWVTPLIGGGVRGAGVADVSAVLQ